LVRFSQSKFKVKQSGRMGFKRPRLQDIAVMSGMSLTTVSRVLNNPSGRFPIAAKTAAKIKAVANEVRYQPNRLARAIAYQRTNLIGLSLPHYHPGQVYSVSSETSIFSALILGDLLAGILDHKDMREYDLVVHDRRKLNSETSKFPFQMDLLDGAIYANPTSTSVESLSNLPEDYPVVLLGECPELQHRITTVDIDNLKAAKKCIHHLFSVGCRRILVLIPEGLGHVLCIQDRLAGYKEAMQELGLKAPTRSFISVAQKPEAVQEFVANFSRWESYDAVVAPDDAICVFCLRCLIQQGFNVPERMAVAGFGNSILAQFSDIPLTTINVPFHDLAHEAVGQLLDQLKSPTKKKPRKIRLEANLSIRGSTVAL
jgi:DNA-binding LacI/PurR family transcriptional regulator